MSKHPRDLALIGASLVALVAPSACGFQAPPIKTFFNEWLAALGWSFLLIHVVQSRRSAATSITRTFLGPMVWVGFLILLVSGWSEVLWGHQQISVILLGSGYLAGAALVFCVARYWAHDELLQESLFFALIASGILNCCVGAIQLFLPSYIDGLLVAAPLQLGRAVGNFQQPNHMASMFLWAMIGAAALYRRSRIRPANFLLLVSIFGAGVVWTGSRTGWLGLAMFCCWLILDRQIKRGRLIAVTLFSWLILVHVVMLWCASQGAFLFYAFSRASQAHSDISSGRIGLWGECWRLIAENFWSGVGVGNFRPAWTFSEISQPGFYGNAHNLFIHWFVELGVLRGGILGFVVLCCMLVFSKKVWITLKSEEKVGASCVPWFFILLIVFLHSMLEFPLWYGYFLFPAAFAFGVCVELSGDGRRSGDVVPSKFFPVVTVLSIAAGVFCCFCLWDYQRLLSASFRSFDIKLVLFENYLGGPDVVSQRLVGDFMMPLPYVRQLKVVGNPDVLADLIRVYCARGDFDKADFLSVRLSYIYPGREGGNFCSGKHRNPTRITFRDFLEDGALH